MAITVAHLRQMLVTAAQRPGSPFTVERIDGFFDRFDSEIRALIAAKAAGEKSLAAALLEIGVTSTPSDNSSVDGRMLYVGDRYVGQVPPGVGWAVVALIHGQSTGKYEAWEVVIAQNVVNNILRFRRDATSDAADQWLRPERTPDKKGKQAPYAYKLKVNSSGFWWDEREDMSDAPYQRGFNHAHELGNYVRRQFGKRFGDKIQADAEMAVKLGDRK